MTRRQDELRPRSYDQLMHAAGEHMDKDALEALRKYQQIRAAGGTPKIQFSGHHGWVVTEVLQAR